MSLNSLAENFIFDANTRHDNVVALATPTPTGELQNDFADSVEFHGLKASQLYFGRSYDDLVVQVEDGNAQVTFNDWFTGGDTELSTIGHFEASNEDGSATLSLSHQDVVALVAAWGAAIRSGGTPDLSPFWH